MKTASLAPCSHFDGISVASAARFIFFRVWCKSCILTFFYLLLPFPPDSEGREDLTANISPACLKLIFSRITQQRLFLGGRKRRERVYRRERQRCEQGATMASDTVWLKKDARNGLVEGGDTVMFPDELTPNCLLPVKRWLFLPATLLDVAALMTAASPAQAAALGQTAKLCLGVYVPEVLRLLKSQYQTFI